MFVSVIIPAYNNPQYIEYTLISIYHQSLEKNLFEVIVIDDGSTVPLSEQVHTPPGIQVRFIRKEHSGRAKTRNRGILESKGEIIIFMDSDLIMTSDFIMKHREIILSGKAEIVLGKVKHIPPERFCLINEIVTNKIILFSELEKITVSEQYLDLADIIFSDNLKRKNIPWVCTLFSNCSIRREVIKKAGMFDEEFKGWGFEDIELGYRFYKEGYKFTYDPEIFNFHLDHSSDRNQMIADMAKNLKYFYMKHPDVIIKYYKSFVAGFMSLNQFYRNAFGVESCLKKGHDNVFFKPLKYSNTKV